VIRGVLVKVGDTPTAPIAGRWNPRFDFESTLADFGASCDTASTRPLPFSQKIEVLADIRPALAALKGRGLALAIVSGTGAGGRKTFELFVDNSAGSVRGAGPRLPRLWDLEIYRAPS
jgi:hypothetical protein